MDPKPWLALSLLHAHPVCCEISKMWISEARRLLRKGPGRVIPFNQDQLESCKVASEISLELFERVIPPEVESPVFSLKESS